MDLQTSCVTHASARVGRGRSSKNKFYPLNAFVIASLVLALSSSAHAGGENTAGQGGSYSGNDSTIASLNADSDNGSAVEPRYSNNAKTNATINAVFNIIQTQGDGLVWNGNELSTQASAAELGDKTSALADARPLPLPSNPNATMTTARLAAHQGAMPFVQVASAGATASTLAPAVSSKNSPDAIFAAALAQPVTPALPTWPVKPGATLQETLTDWSRKEGWSDPKWLPQNPYQIEAMTTPIQGTFIDALSVIAANVPQLDISVSTERRELTVTEAGSK